MNAKHLVLCFCCVINYIQTLTNVPLEAMAVTGSSICVNTIGSFKCSCNFGYDLVSETCLPGKILL